MLYVFGGDRIKSRAKMRATFDALVKRAPFAHTIRITNEDIEQADIKNLLDAQGLFYAKRIVVFDNAFRNKDAQEKVSPYMEALAKSDHVFLILEEDLDDDVKKQLLAHATKASITESKKEKEKTADWSMANALESKDGKRLWLALARALLQDAPIEQIHGQLFWKAKQMLLEKRFRRWNEREIQTLIARLAELPHDARRKGIEVEYILERFALSIQLDTVSLTNRI